MRSRRHFLGRHFLGLWSALAVMGGLCAAAVPALTQPAPGKPLRVVTTFTIIQDMAQNAAGNVAIVESITKPGA